MPEDKYSYSILKFDQYGTIIDTFTIVTDRIKNIKVIEDSVLIGLFLHTSGVNIADSLGHTDDYSYNYSIRQSKDMGQSWDTLLISLPIKQNLSKKFDGTYFFSDIIIDFSEKIDDYILFPTRNKKIFKYNYKLNTIDSCSFPVELINNQNLSMFKCDSVFSFVSNNTEPKIYRTKELSINPLWDSININTIFFDWKNYDFVNKPENKDAILFSKSFNDEHGFLITGLSKEFESFSMQYQLNIAKYLIDKISKIDQPELQILAEKVNFWNSNPYPMPGKDIIHSLIYWNKNYSIRNSKIKIFDSFGKEYFNKDVKIEDFTNYCGLLSWDISGFINGTYFIQIILSNEVLNIPVLIAK